MEGRMKQLNHMVQLTIPYYGRLTRTGTQNKQTRTKLLNGNTTGIKHKGKFVTVFVILS